MGLFDFMRSKSRDTAPANTAPPAPTGPTFEHDGDVYPMPPGWDGLSLEQWYAKAGELQLRLGSADELNLPTMTDEDGDELDPAEVLLRQEGFRDGSHYESFRTWGMINWARQTGESPTDLEHRMSSIATQQRMANQAAAMAAPGGQLAPVEGVTCEQWALINAGISSGENMHQVLAQQGLDPAKWERVTAEWTSRMSADTSMAISTVYGNAIANYGRLAPQTGHAAQVGVAGDLSDEPMPFERYCELEAAMNCAAERGEDVNPMFAQFGITALEWGQVSMFWSTKMSQEASKYYALYTEYSAKYTAKYS